MNKEQFYNYIKELGFYKISDKEAEEYTGEGEFKNFVPPDDPFYNFDLPTHFKLANLPIYKFQGDLVCPNIYFPTSCILIIDGNLTLEDDFILGRMGSVVLVTKDMTVKNMHLEEATFCVKGSFSFDTFIADGTNDLVSAIGKIGKGNKFIHVFDNFLIADYEKDEDESVILDRVNFCISEQLKLFKNRELLPKKYIEYEDIENDYNYICLATDLIAEDLKNGEFHLNN